MSNFESSLRFKKYYVDKINFIRNENFKNENGIEIEFEIDSNIKKITNEIGEISLSINIFKNGIKNNRPFEIDLTISGIFEIENIEDRYILEQNTLAILFPYARAIVSTYTANANVAPLILPPINIVAYLDNKYKKEIKESGE